MRAHTPHNCPHCRCEWDTSDEPGKVNRDAPFYTLVEAVLDATESRPPAETVSR